jgi:triosephosphate isomerase
MKKYVIANWKSHKSNESCGEWLETFTRQYRGRGDTEIIIAPSMVSLDFVSSRVRLSGSQNISVAAQDVSPYPLGSYTGAVAADLLKPFAKYAIVGHSERRRYFHETLQDTVNKIVELTDSSITPVICIESVDLFRRLVNLVELAGDNFIVAYTPVDAVNFAIPESVGKVAEAVVEIDRIFPGCAIVYGGAIIHENAGKYFAVSGLSGLFVGSASLEVDSFLKICAQV